MIDIYKNSLKLEFGIKFPCYLLDVLEVKNDDGKIIASTNDIRTMRWFQSIYVFAHQLIETFPLLAAQPFEIVKAFEQLKIDTNTGYDIMVKSKQIKLNNSLDACLMLLLCLCACVLYFLLICQFAWYLHYAYLFGFVCLPAAICIST